MINAGNFCHVETVSDGINVLFYVEYDGDEAILHQITVLEIGTLDLTVTMPSDKLEEQWPHGIRFGDAAKKLITTAEELGFQPRPGAPTDAPAPANHVEGRPESVQAAFEVFQGKPDTGPHARAIFHYIEQLEARLSAPAPNVPPILKGVGKINGDGWKDSTRIGEIVFVWNREHPKPYAAGQFPRVGREHWSASTEQFEFFPATLAEIEALFSLPAQNVEGTFDGAIDTDTPLQSAAREAGWALTTLIDVSDWQKRDQISGIIARLAVALRGADTVLHDGQDISTPPNKTNSLLLAVSAVLAADKDFREHMPADWEGDPLTDEIDGLRTVFEGMPTPAEGETGL